MTTAHDVQLAASLDAAVLDAEYARLCGETDDRAEEEARFLAAEAEKLGRMTRPARLAKTFSLSGLELDLILLSIAPEVAPGLSNARRLLELLGVQGGRPAVAAALSLPSACDRWMEVRDALAPAATLRHWRLLTLTEPADPLPVRELIAEARVADYLLGGVLLSAELQRIARPHTVPARGPQAVDGDGVEAIAERAMRSFFQSGVGGRRLFLVLSGVSLAEMEDLAAGILAGMEMRLLVIDAAGLSAADRTLGLRESLLAQTGILVHGVAGGALEPAEQAEWYRWLATAAPVVFLTSPVDQAAATATRPEVLDGHGWVNLAVPALTTAERMRAWTVRLRELGLDAAVAPVLAEAATLTTREIAQTVVSSAAQVRAEGHALTTDDLLRACRLRIPNKLLELSQHIVCAATWEDLILPVETRARLQELCQQAKHRHDVFVTGGFSRTLARGRAVTGLFWGPSGTGKTMAAETVARALHRELYRVDSARIVSKYIGETEKNLRQIFDEAERARCVLFFDEADALFGTRGEVRDSTDRYANLEVSYLLQRMEEAEFAVILLASNRRQAIDDAFHRRFRFMIEFAMPSAAMRRDLWRASFPPEFPLDAGVRLELLAERLPLSGASIRNIALAAAFLAAAEAPEGIKPICAAHVGHAVRREFEKLSSPMPASLAELTSPSPSMANRRAGGLA